MPKGTIPGFMRPLLISLLLLALSLPSTHVLAGENKKWRIAGLTGASNSDSLLAELSKTIPLSAGYDTARTREITRLRQALTSPGQSLNTVFDRQGKIYEQYKTFN